MGYVENGLNNYGSVVIIVYICYCRRNQNIRIHSERIRESVCRSRPLLLIYERDIIEY